MADHIKDSKHNSDHKTEKKSKINVNIESEVLKIVDNERRSWEDGITFVTEKVAFNIRNLIRQLRKNYWGIYDNPQDVVTKKRKVWIPLTESVVDTFTKNIDLDTKNIDPDAKRGSSIKLVPLVKTWIANWLDNHNFGETLDIMERGLAIDGSAVWKTIEIKEKGKAKMVRSDVDLLNLYFDNVGHETLNEKYRVTERALMPKEAIDMMDGWVNTEDMKATEGLHPFESRLRGTQNQGQTTMQIDVWEMWGAIPKSLITGKKEDETTDIEGHLVVSGLDGSDARVHLVEENTKVDINGDVIRPYEECHGKRVPGRWLARSPAESVMMLQIWLNTIVNIRISRALFSQLGIFKIRKRAGITPQMMSKIGTNGAILVDDQDDIQQMVLQEASQASYADEGNIRDWAREITSTFESVTGEQLPASTPATNAILQTRAAQSSFAMIRKNIGSFIERWIERHAMPIMMKNMTSSDVIRQSGNVEDLKAMDERIVNEMAWKALKKIEKKGQRINPEQVLESMEKARAKLKAMGSSRFIQIVNKIDLTEFDITVNVTDEKIDKGVQIANLLQSLAAVPEARKIVLAHIFDLMGLPINELDKIEVAPALPVGATGEPVPAGAVEAPTQNAQEQFLNANLPTRA